MSGLLILTKPSNLISNRFEDILKKVSNRVHKTLYIYLNFNKSTLPVANYDVTKCDYYRKCATKIYMCASSCQVDRRIDCRVLLMHLKSPKEVKYANLNNNVNILFSDQSNLKNKHIDLENILGDKKNCIIDTVNIIDDVSSDIPSFSESISSDYFNSVVLGGTFDRLHSGHKALLSAAILLTNQKLTIGVTDDTMTLNKHLSFMVQPLNRRIEILREFLLEVDPSIDYNIVSISDSFGPSTVDPDIQCIVVSNETINGAFKVNEERSRKKLSHLHVHSIDLIGDAKVKLSSSILRESELGKIIHPPKLRTSKPHTPYLIGLTGCIASGKSSIAKQLENFGAKVIDCDKLGHKSYAKGSAAFKSIVEEFGSDVVNENGEIDRKLLGSKVFSDAAKLTKLNEIVWPSIHQLIHGEITDVQSSDPNCIIVLDAAVLLEAGWDALVDQVWVTTVAEEDAVHRIVERNKISEQEARKRIKSQINDSVRLDRADLIFCTQFEPEKTKIQVERAWNDLNIYLEQLNK